MDYQSRREELWKKLSTATVEDTDFVLEVFRFQYLYNPMYQRFVDLLKVKVASVCRLEDIPFLPISFYKNFEIKTGSWVAQAVFLSSRTGGTLPSRHYIRSYNAYLQNTVRCFYPVFGDPSSYSILALLPSYLEQGQSSLVAMVEGFIGSSKQSGSGFFKDDMSGLCEQILFNIQCKTPTILIGVSYALLDFAERYPIDLSKITILETGGMKGRRAEIPKAALHYQLQEAFMCESIGSEYGMTELQSQAYAKKKGYFVCPQTMKVLISSLHDPRTWVQAGERGQLNIVDLANLDTCAFIRTDDYGRSLQDGGFEVLGRLDGSEQRGCNLMLG